ncbi:hydroxyproline-rich glycoprotein [Populus alba x Populus x berolinensis]|nr:hydroxyproline-rich glycoprotein [Populus alba x Populus x berolinensis]
MQNSYSHANQMQSNHLPNQRMYRGQGPDHNAASYRSPRGFSGPFPMNQGAPPEMWTGPGGPASYFSSTLHGGLSCPYPIRQGNPGFGPVGSSPSPVSGYGGSPAISQTGQGNWHSSSGFGQSGGRGQGFRSRGFAPNEAQEPECFYDNSMVEDPWQHLEPVLWSGQ